MAGEGIEYLWGFMKRKYRRNWSARDAHRQSTKDFTDLVESLLDGTIHGPVTKELCRKMAARARRYMVAYAELEKECSYK